MHVHSSKARCLRIKSAPSSIGSSERWRDGAADTAFQRADGCTCDDATIDAHSSATRESTHRVYCLPVTQARRCRVTLTVLPSTSSGEHKWLLHELHVLHVERGPDGGAAAMGADGSCEKLLR